MDCELIVDTGQGLTSCLSVRLHDACRFYEKHGHWPCEIDSRGQFKQYQVDAPICDRLVTYDPSRAESLMSNGFDHGWQMGWFDEIDIVGSGQLAMAICEPSKEVGIRALQFFTRIFDRTGVLFRGNDKAKEMPIASYDDMIRLAYLSESNKFFLQTDEQEFVEYFIKHFPDTIVFDEIPRIPSNPHRYVMPSTAHRVEFALNFNAVLLAMSMLPKVCLTNGNTSMWVALYRGHLQGCLQLHTLCDNAIKYFERNQIIK